MEQKNTYLQKGHFHSLLINFGWDVKFPNGIRIIKIEIGHTPQDDRPKTKLHENNPKKWIHLTELNTIACEGGVTKSTFGIE